MRRVLPAAAILVGAVAFTISYRVATARACMVYGPDMCLGAAQELSCPNTTNPTNCEGGFYQHVKQILSVTDGDNPDEEYFEGVPQTDFCITTMSCALRSDPTTNTTSCIPDGLPRQSGQKNCQILQGDCSSEEN